MVVGSRGPIPKREEERRRQNKPDIPTDTPEVVGPVAVPEPDPEWHPVARSLYESLRESGQSQFYEPSDWAAAYLLAESMSRDLSVKVIGVTKDGEVIRDQVPINGASMSSYLKGLAALGATEGDRRRMSIQLRRVRKAAPKNVSVMDDYRNSFGG